MKGKCVIVALAVALGCASGGVAAARADDRAPLISYAIPGTSLSVQVPSTWQVRTVSEPIQANARSQLFDAQNPHEAENSVWVVRSPRGPVTWEEFVKDSRAMGGDHDQSQVVTVGSLRAWREAFVVKAKKKAKRRSGYGVLVVEEQPDYWVSIAVASKGASLALVNRILDNVSQR